MEVEAEAYLDINFLMEVKAIFFLILEAKVDKLKRNLEAEAGALSKSTASKTLAQRMAQVSLRLV